MNHPDVILFVDADADRLPQHPVVGHRLRPERIDFETRGLFSLGYRFLQIQLGAAESHHDRQQTGPDIRLAIL